MDSTSLLSTNNQEYNHTHEQKRENSQRYSKFQSNTSHNGRVMF
jgi:hypothetical protein